MVDDGITPRPPAERVAVIGDVGGHREALVAELARLGVPEQGQGAIPSHLTVIQVGDLVHRGPDSAGVVALVDRHLAAQPRRWVQLIGNHEAQYVRRPAFRWPERIDATSARTLQRWWHDGQMQAATWFACAGEHFLVTHAGLTAGFWRGLGSPASARGAADALNRLARTGEESLFRGGRLLGGGVPDLRAGPLWAAAATELIPSWNGTRLPFSQIHGHCSIVSPDRVAGPGTQHGVAVDSEAGHEVVTLEGGRIIGVDPGHDTLPRESWHGWVAIVRCP